MPSIVRSSFLGLCCGCLALLGNLAPASAALVTYEFRVCENLSVLTNPYDPVVAQQAVQTTVQALIIARDTPYFQIINTSMDALASLTSFRLTIPANRPNNFDYVDWISASPGVSYTINQPDTVNDGLRSKFIDISFSGLTTGKSVIFRGDIDWTTGDPNFQTDYRTALFSANSTDPITNNALLEVGFNNDPNLVNSSNLPNFTTNGTVYSCICFRNPAQVDHVMPFMVVQAIPEPGPIAVFALMLGGAWWWHRRMKEMTRKN